MASYMPLSLQCLIIFSIFDFMEVAGKYFKEAIEELSNRLSNQKGDYPGISLPHGFFKISSKASTTKSTSLSLRSV